MPLVQRGTAPVTTAPEDPRAWRSDVPHGSPPPDQFHLDTQTNLRYWGEVELRRGAPGR